MRLQQLVIADISSQHVVGGQVTTIEGEEELTEPIVRGRTQRVEDRVQEQFAEVVDRV